MSKLTVYASSEPTTPIAILEDAAAIQEVPNRYLVGEGYTPKHKS